MTCRIVHLFILDAIRFFLLIADPGLRSGIANPALAMNTDEIAVGSLSAAPPFHTQKHTPIRRVLLFEYSVPQPKGS